MHRLGDDHHVRVVVPLVDGQRQQPGRQVGFRSRTVEQLGPKRGDEDAPAVQLGAIQRTFREQRIAVRHSVDGGREPKPVQVAERLVETRKVRTAALRALGETKRGELTAFLRERFEQDNSYVAQAEALSALGKVADASIKPFLAEAAGLDSPRDVVERAARQAIEGLEERRNE